MSKWFFTADLHLGHSNIIKYCKRPFLDYHDLQICDLIKKGLVPASDLKINDDAVQDMDTTIIDNINSKVDKDDNLVIVGDFCLSKSSHNRKTIQSYRDRITCKNIYLIYGNHDHRSACQDVFTACYENYLFKIDGQQIFTSHYPCRSWDRASHGAWMIYGHVHNIYHPEDNGELMPYEKNIFSEGFQSVLLKYGVKLAEEVCSELLQVCASIKGINLTLDVGVDNVRSGVPFGTPWSMEDIRNYMLPKYNLWHSRKAANKSFC
jgi:calcineurin-like phosphoesterase family protein